MTMPAPTPAPIATKRTSPAPRARRRGGAGLVDEALRPKLLDRGGDRRRAGAERLGEPDARGRPPVAECAEDPNRRAPSIRGVGRRRLDRLQHLPYFRRITE